MFFFDRPYYLIILALQAICVIHCIRKGNQNNWIWLIVFLPVIGCLIYFFSEIATRHQVRSISTGVSGMIRPTLSIRKLEENLRFSDTFANRMALADACLAKGETERAIRIYEESLTGAFAENEHGMMQLIRAYYREKRYDEVIRLARKIRHLPQFNRSEANIFYAMSLGSAGHPEEAEKEFLAMKGKYSNFEARYYYSLFLQRNERPEEARQVLTDIKNEIPQLSAVERRHNRAWLPLAKEALKKNT